MTAALKKLREGTVRKRVKQTHPMAYEYAHLLAAVVSTAQPILFNIIFIFIVLLIVHSCKNKHCIANTCILSINIWCIDFSWEVNPIVYD